METKIEKTGKKAKEIALMIQSERIDKQDAATMIGVCVGTISNYVKKGLLTPIKLGTTKQSPVFFKRDEVLKLRGFEMKENAFQR